MIEIVYKEDSKENKVERQLTLPKNIRQVGEPELGRKIYIEDYVTTYLQQYAKEEMLNTRAAILLGNSDHMKDTQYIFIRRLALRVQNLLCLWVFLTML